MENHSNATEVTRGGILPVFLKFTVPDIISILAYSSSGIVDAMFLGRYAGQEALAAVNIINPLLSFCLGIAIMFTAGGAVRAGKYIGEGSIEKASSIFTKTMTAITAVTLAVSLTGIFLNGWSAAALGANDELMPPASRYLKIMSFFLLFNTVGYAMSVFIRIDGRPILASAGLLTASLLNILLDFLLVGAAGMGVTGAALATGIASAAGFAVLSSHFATGKNKLKPAFGGKGWTELFLAAYNGLSEFVSEISAGVIMLMFNKIMINRFDTQGVAAFSAINYLMWGGGMINYGVADSLSPLVSINYGAKKTERIAGFMRLAVIFVFTNGLIIFALLTFIPGALIGIFITDSSSDAFKIAVNFASYIRWAFFLNGVNQVFSAYFTAIHRPLESTVISSSRGFVLPLLFLSTFPYIFGDNGIFTAIPCSEAIAFAAAVYLWKINSPSKRIERTQTM